MKRIEQQIAAVGAMSPTDLHKAWQAPFGAPPPQMPPSLMARAITHAMQVKRYGGLDRRSVKFLGKLADALEQKAKTDTAMLPKKPTAGTRYVREWGGRTHYVEAVDDGRFVYDGKLFGSLSEIARDITGTRWSGPRFFGRAT